MKRVLLSSATNRKNTTNEKKKIPWLLPNSNSNFAHWPLRKIYDFWQKKFIDENTVTDYYCNAIQQNEFFLPHEVALAFCQFGCSRQEIGKWSLWNINIRLYMNTAAIRVVYWTVSITVIREYILLESIEILRKSKNK